jgi:ribosome-binding factor A
MLLPHYYYRIKGVAAAFVSRQQQIICQQSTSSSDDDRVGEHQHYIIDELERPQSPPINIGLEAIKSAGMAQLHNQTQDIISRTRQPLFEDVDLLDDDGNKRKSVAQIQEAARIECAIEEALVEYSSRYDTFNIKGQVIDVLGVEVSPDLRQARVYWGLPRVLDLEQLSSSRLEQVVRMMQKILDERGGKIQGIVHSRLRAYYPPKLKWVAAEHVSKDLKRGISLEKDKRKWR